jgi:iron(III) transport system permease protein
MTTIDNRVTLGETSGRWSIRKLGLSPGVAILAIILAGLVLPPFYYLVKTSLYTTNADGSFGAFTLEYYSDLFGSGYLFGDFLNSVKFAVGSAMVAIVIGTAQAWLVERTDAPMRQYVFLASVVSLGLPHVLYTSAWLLILGKNGPINALLEAALGTGGPVIDIYGLSGMILIEGMIWSPLAFLLLSPTFRASDGAFEEAAVMSGASVATTFRRVTVPLAAPGLLALTLLIVIRAFEAFDIPALVGSAGDVSVLTTEVYNSIRKELPSNYGQAGAFSMVLMAAVVMLLLMQQRLLRHAERFQTITGKGYKPRMIRLGAYRFVATGFLLLSFLILFVLPVGMVVLVSLQPFYSGIDSGTLSRISLVNYQHVFQGNSFRSAIGNTLMLGVASATFVCGLTAGAAWLAARRRPFSGILDQLATLPLIFPAIVLSVAFLQLFLSSPVPLYGTLISLIIAATVQYLPYGMRFSYAGALQIHHDLEEAAVSAGATHFDVFRRIVFPLLLPTIVTSWLFVMLLSVRAVAMPILLAGPKSQVVAVALFDLWTNGQVTELAAFGVVWSAFMMVIGGLFYVVSKRYSVAVQ